jgi:ATP-dependent Lon protease
MDRMDVVEISGYTEKEKLEIAKGFIVKRQLEQSGLAVRKIRFEPAALVRIIGAYTREAGVRNLEREVQRICRKLARRKLEGRLEGSLKITAAGLVEFLGQARYHVNPGELAPAFGLAKGLAWTESGGQVLDVEARLLPGRGRVILTGKLGQVMQESARTAFSWVRELAGRSDVSIDFSRSDVHLHVPEGALPKDGPSAGITIAVAIASAVLNLPVDNRYAMTGELSLLGKVLPIGGLKEKLLAARRSGFRRLILPQANEPDISRLSEEVRGGIEIFYVKNMGEVLLHVLPVPAKRPGQARAPLYPKKNGGTDENAYPGQ